MSKCEKCNKDLIVDTRNLLLSYPPKYKATCPLCGEVSYILAEDSKEHQNSKYSLVGMKFGKRNENIYFLRDKCKFSLRKIGKYYNLSGEQVRLICNRIERFLKSPEINFMLTGEGFKGKYVGELGFSKRTLNALEKAGIYTIEELKQKSYNDIVNMKGVGQVGAQEIFNKVLEVIKYEER